MRVQRWLRPALALLLVYMSAPCLTRAEEEAAAVPAGPKAGEVDAPPHSFGFDSDGDDDDDDWDRIFEEQRRLDAAVETDAAGQPIAGDYDDAVVPGLSGLDLTAFNAELADKAVLEKIVDWAYDAVALRSPYKDTFVHAEDLYDLLLKTLNPLEDELDPADYDTLHEAVRELRADQGLLDDSMVIYRGFISRGAPLRFLQTLAHRMHSSSATTARRRRLEEL